MKASKIQLIGGLHIGAANTNDYSFYSNLFSRLNREVKNTGSLTRYVSFTHFTGKKPAITFLGIEVNSTELIPTGMIAWKIDDNRLTVIEEKNGKNNIIWRTDVHWLWRNEPSSDDSKNITGEFSARIPPQWCKTNDARRCHFSITANAYAAPGQTDCDDSILLVDYDPAWPQKFARFSDWLRNFLGPDIALEIEHIGSTSIPAMISKPVIDILVAVPSILKAKQRAIPAFNQKTWEYWWYNDRMIFIKRDKLMGTRTHHLHLMPKGQDYQAHLAFRDHIRSHAQDALRYAALKKRLSGRHKNNREHYTDAKASFINEIVKKANHKSLFERRAFTCVNQYATKA
ncbi:MAG: GrpB family protein [Desulfobacteraceae bacterium]|nr:GrpB family protein [Desulfobacteraceae bacterium]